MALTTYARMGIAARRLFWDVLRDPDLVFLHVLNETSGATAYDRCTKNTLDGTIAASPTLGASLGKGYYGMTLDGSTQSINVGDESALSFERTGAFSGLCVLNPNVSATGSIISKVGTGVPGWVWAILSTGAPLVNLEVTDATNECIVLADATLTNGTTYMLGFSKAAGTGAASEITLYKNGAVDADTDLTDTLASGSLDNAADVVIGANDIPSTHLNGTLGLIAMFNAAKTAADYKRWASIGGF